jgi:hypothetical protein
MELTCGGSKTVVPMISGTAAAGAAGAGAAAVWLTAAVWACVWACGVAWLTLAGFWSFCGAVQAAAIKTAPMTTAVRRIGDKCLLDIEISVQISRTA